MRRLSEETTVIIDSAVTYTVLSSTSAKLRISSRKLYRNIAAVTACALQLIIQSQTLLGAPMLSGTRLTIMGTNSPQEVRYAPRGGDVEIRTDIPDHITGVRWYKDGQLFSTTPGATLLRLPNVQFSDAGYYSIRGADGENLTTFELTVLDLPTDYIDTHFRADLDSAWPIGVDQTAAVIVGTTTSLTNGETTTQYLKLQPNGEIDPHYSLPTSAGAIIEVTSDGTVFTSLPPYRFDSNGNPKPLSLPSTLDPNTPLQQVEVDQQGRLILGQSYTANSGHPVLSQRLWKLARLHSKGTEDLTFDFGPARPGEISAVVPSLSGDYVVIYRSTFTGLDFLSRENHVARLSEAGSEFVNLIDFTHADTVGISVAETSSGNLLVGESRYDFQRLRLYQSDGAIIDPDHHLLLEQSARWWLLSRDSLLHTVNSGRGLVRRSPETFEADPYFFVNRHYEHTWESAHSIRHLLVAPDDQLLIAGDFDDWSGHPTRSMVRIKRSAAKAEPPPYGFAQKFRNGKASNSGELQRHDLIELIAVRDSAEEVTTEWIALSGQTVPTSVDPSRVIYSNFDLNHLGKVGLKMTSALGIMIAPPLSLIPSEPVRLANLSGRVWIDDDGSKPILGFSLKGGRPHRAALMVLRAVGPTLSDFGVLNTLNDPLITLYDRNAFAIDTNDNWRAVPAEYDPAVYAGAFPLRHGSNDATLVSPLTDNGNYTALIDSPSDVIDEGVALIETYHIDADFAPRLDRGSRLYNLSLRSHTGIGDKVLIGGLVVEDPQGFERSARVLVRAIGPTLGDYGVEGALTNPRLEIYDSHGLLVTNNDRWMDDTEAAVIEELSIQVGAFPLPTNSNDAATLVTLPADSYTIHVNGVNDETGTALLEIYLIEQ